MAFGNDFNFDIRIGKKYRTKSVKTELSHNRMVLFIYFRKKVHSLCGYQRGKTL